MDKLVQVEQKVEEEEQVLNMLLEVGEKEM